MEWRKPTAEKVTGTFQSHLDRKSVNPGVDFGCSVGSDVLAIADGVVSFVDSSNDGAGGRVLHLTFAGGYSCDYLHLSKILVKKGDKVKAGQLIAKSGASGFGKENGYDAHLHLSFRKGKGICVNDGNLDYVKFHADHKKAAK